MVVKSIKDRLQRKFHVAVAETGVFGAVAALRAFVVSVSGARTVLESQMEAISRDLEERFGSELVGTSFDLIE